MRLLIPLVPLRERVRDGRAAPGAGESGLGQPNDGNDSQELRTAAPAWNTLLGQAGRLLAAGDLTAAWQATQRALLLRTRWECRHRQTLDPTAGQWIVLCACLLSQADWPAARALARRAWESACRDWTQGLDEDFCDSCADAMSLTGIMRLCEHCPDEAEALMTAAAARHAAVADLQQVVADRLVLALCQEQKGAAAQAAATRQSARKILENELDSERHFRFRFLSDWLDRCGQTRPFLLKGSRIV